MGQKFTEYQRGKLVKLGFTNVCLNSQNQMLKGAFGSFSKKIGTANLIIRVRDGYIYDFSITIMHQGKSLTDAYNRVADFQKAVDFVKDLGYFN